MASRSPACPHFWDVALPAGVGTGPSHLSGLGGARGPRRNTRGVRAGSVKTEPSALGTEPPWPVVLPRGQRPAARSHGRARLRGVCTSALRAAPPAQPPPPALGRERTENSEALGPQGLLLGSQMMLQCEFETGKCPDSDPPQARVPSQPAPSEAVSSCARAPTEVRPRSPCCRAVTGQLLIGRTDGGPSSPGRRGRWSSTRHAAPGPVGPELQDAGPPALPTRVGPGSPAWSGRPGHAQVSARHPGGSSCRLPESLSRPRSAFGIF